MTCALVVTNEPPYALHIRRAATACSLHGDQSIALEATSSHFNIRAHGTRQHL